MRRFESSRPSQHLINKIRRFLNLPDFHSDGPPRPHSDALFLMRSPAHGHNFWHNFSWSLIGRGADSSWHILRGTVSRCHPAIFLRADAALHKSNGGPPDDDRPHVILGIIDHCRGGLGGCNLIAGRNRLEYRRMQSRGSDDFGISIMVRLELPQVSPMPRCYVWGLGPSPSWN